MTDSISNAFAGMQGAARAFEGAAQRLAAPGAAGSSDTVGAVLGLLDARNGFELNTAVLRSAADMQKRLLDIMV